MVKQLASWVYKQNRNYKSQTEIMKSLILRLEWKAMTNLYPQLFTTKQEQQWVARLDTLKQYIASEKRLPSLGSKDEIEKQLGNWVSKQKINYRFEMETMKIQDIRAQWEIMISQYSELFLTSSQQWMVTFVNLQRYIAATNHLPLSSSKDPKVKQLASWVSKQKQNYKNQTEIMKNQNIVALWEDFLHRYPQLFLTSEQQWMIMFGTINPPWVETNPLVTIVPNIIIESKDHLPSNISNDPMVSQKILIPKLALVATLPLVTIVPNITIESNNHLPSNISNDPMVSHKS